MGRAEFCVLDSMDTFKLSPKSSGRVAIPVATAVRSLRWKYSKGLAKMVSFRWKPAVGRA